MRAMTARVLTIAGSDSGGGAGIQADLKTFEAHGVYGMSVVTALTAQNTHGVRGVHEAPAAFVAAQIDAVLEDLGADAIKIGMVASAEIAEAVAERLAWWAPKWGHPPVVLDPVMVAQSGDALLRDDAVEVILRRLLPLAAVVTPNLPEAARLLGTAVESEEQQADAATKLAEISGAALVKGGHRTTGELVDVLAFGAERMRFAHPRIETRSTHGTGCTLSSAIAARLARGEELVDAVGGAIDYLDGALRRAPGVGGGAGPVGHAAEGYRSRSSRSSRSPGGAA
jgi:hydroxymethylpyrimidine/phosphomethylpyrimidine kinase